MNEGCKIARCENWQKQCSTKYSILLLSLIAVEVQLRYLNDKEQLDHQMSNKYVFGG